MADKKGNELELVKQLREETGLGIMDCKKALEKAGGQIERARELLKSRGAEISARKSSRQANQGVIDNYVHLGSKIGAMVEVNCETDFVARNEIFRDFTRNLCLQIVAASPRYVRPEDIPEEELASRREWWRKEAPPGKPERIIEKILEGKAAEYRKQAALLSQPFIREPEKTIQDYLNEVTARLGEKITIRRFVRMQLGE